ncbi:MAG: recombinase, partial [Oscillospiraceae bacterium]
GRRGGLEIKTAEIQRAGDWNKWRGRLPAHYYIQCLHQMLASGWEFVILKAQIRHRRGGELEITTRHYHIERSEVEKDISALLAEEMKFWGHVRDGIRPDLVLPPI